MADPRPDLVMVAGPNGSGKTTLIQAMRADSAYRLPSNYINADDIQRSTGAAALQAQAMAQKERARAIAAREPILFETVMSHPSKIAELQQAVDAGYKITVVFVATDSPDTNVQRVAVRVQDGGHDVPEDRTRARYARSLALAPSAIGHADEAYVFDNSTQRGHELQAELIGSELQTRTSTPRPWAAELIGTVNARATELEAITRPARERGVLVAPSDAEAGQTIGPIVAQFKYYALQLDQAHEIMVIHDKASLGAALRDNEVYRIDYAQGVARATRLIEREG